MTQKYNDPINGSPSDIGATQMNEFFYQKKALIEAKKEQYFLPLADVTAMPKNFGKKIKKYHYIPLLDDENLNDQGIDAAGATIDSSLFFVSVPALVQEFPNTTDANNAKNAWDSLGGDPATVNGTTVTYPSRQSAATSEATVDAALASLPGAYKVQNSGNLYGSSKDVGLISGKFPALSETGGRVNRVGVKRKEVEGSIEKFGIFDEYTQESLDFDSDSELLMHITREMVLGASEMTEDLLQIDLLNNAGVVKYAGTATDMSELDDTEVTYRDLLRLSIDLDNNRTPKHTRVITGTRLIDTKTIPAARVMYIGSELQPLIEEKTDFHGERAFIPVHKYGAAAGTTLNGEIGTVGYFRIVVVPEMMKFAGAGGDATGNSTHYSTNGRYDVFPMLVVGDGSFSTIGFQTDGKTVKFKIYHKKPGMEMADLQNPYGEVGFMSIKWYYGFLLLRPERLAVVYTTAKM